MIATGVLLLLFGVGAGCVGLMMPMLLMIPNTPQQDARYMVVVAALYLGISAGLVWLGVGACRAKRWVRPMIVALGWPLVIVGTVGLISFVANIGPFMDLMGSSPTSPGVPRAVGIIAAVVAILFQAVLMVGAPLAMVLYIRRPRTEEVLCYYDPRKNWTDECPQAVLTWAMALAVSGGMGLLGLARPVVPMPGFVLRGLPAAALVLAIVLALLWMAYGTYRLRMAAWWASLVLSIVGSAWWMVLMMTGSMVEYWKEVGTDERQMEFMRQTSGGVTSTIVWLVMAAITIGYILSIRKHFGKAPVAAVVDANDLAQQGGAHLPQ